jgi:Xaa-Pro aminopeptidase
LDRDLIDPAMLADDERAWIDAYHTVVKIDLEGLLEGRALAWMIDATRPLT